MIRREVINFVFLTQANVTAFKEISVTYRKKPRFWAAELPGNESSNGR